MDKQPLENQTLYAELLEQLRAREALRTIGALEGSFVEKKVKNTCYIYFQYYDPGGTMRQLYVGKKTPDLDKLVETYRSERKIFAQEMHHIQRLCAQLRSGDALTTDHASARVINQMAESGVFRLGGILVGTHAYIVLGNVLGVFWEHAAIRTRDIDIATTQKELEEDVSLVIPQIDSDIPKALESLKMGFLPIPQFDHRQPSTSFMIRGKALRVDILTPQRKQQTNPVYIPRFKVAAQPLRFLDYLMEEKIQAAVVDGGGTLVNVPSPARYAIHKLIVSQERSIGAHAKKEKDLFQANQLISLLSEERPGDIRIAVESAIVRGQRWKKRVDAGLAELEKRYGLSVRGILSDSYRFSK
jgi:hypothetical protein